MEKSLLTAYAKRLHPLQPVFLTFSKDGIVGVSRLIGLTRSCPGVRIDSQDYSATLAVEMSQEWGHDRNRTIKVHGLQHADPALLEQIARDVEKVAVPDHGAKALFTRRVKTFQGAVVNLVHDVVTQELEQEIESWGLRIEAKGFQQAFPGVYFYIKDDKGKILLDVFLDGWSGRMAVNGVFGDELYVHPKQVRDLIRQSLEACLESLTATA